MEFGIRAIVKYLVSIISILSIVVNGQLTSTFRQPVYHDIDQLKSSPLANSLDDVFTAELLARSPDEFQTGYLVMGQQANDDLPRLIDASKLKEFLSRISSSMTSVDDLQHNTSDDQQEMSSAVVDDVNIHLPPSNPLEGIIAGPVNDPAEFEAALSQFTDTLNHKLPNSGLRSAILDNLFVKDQPNNNVNTDSLDRQFLDGLNQLLKSSNGIENRDERETNSDDLGDQSISTTSASRYGGSEYIDNPLALVGHQYVQGGAGEGRQLLGPDGTFENVQVVKSDHAVPSYCDPPNPCPIGYTAKDGCLEEFVNSASFSREYQAKQRCSCDNEHSLFNCGTGPVSSLKNKQVEASDKPSNGGDQGKGDGDGGDDDDGDNDIESGTRFANALAQTIQNRFGDW